MRVLAALEVIAHDLNRFTIGDERASIDDFLDMTAQSRFFMRLILLIVRLAGLIGITAGWFCLWLLWVAIPIVIVTRLISFFILS